MARLRSLSGAFPRRWRWRAIVSGILLVGCFCGVHALAQAPAKRARAPQFPKSVDDTFFPDARAKLSGPRPAVRVTSPQPASAATVVDRAPAASGGTWSALISAEAIEDEIKAGQPELAVAVQNATVFKGGQYQQARRHLSVLSAMLGIAAEFDARVRWQREAGAFSHLLGRAAANTKVASDSSFNECRARAEELETLVRGGTISLPAGNDASAPGQLPDRPSLMQRLEIAHQQRLAPAVANEREFSRQSERLAHEAEIVAALARWITREGYEYSDDETFTDYAQDMQQQATALRSAVQSGDFEQARQATAKLGQSCTACHEGYRG